MRIFKNYIVVLLCSQIGNDSHKEHLVKKTQKAHLFKDIVVWKSQFNSSQIHFYSGLSDK